MINPTIGRVVWFYPASDEMIHPNLGQPHAALVAFVHGDRMVNLAIVDALGKPYNMTSVRLLQDDDPVPLYGYYATWMPYQKAVAESSVIASWDVIP